MWEYVCVCVWYVCVCAEKEREPEKKRSYKLWHLLISGVTLVACLYILDEASQKSGISNNAAQQKTHQIDSTFQMKCKSKVNTHHFGNMVDAAMLRWGQHEIDPFTPTKSWVTAPFQRSSFSIAAHHSNAMKRIQCDDVRGPCDKDDREAPYPLIFSHWNLKLIPCQIHCHPLRRKICLSYIFCWSVFVVWKYYR